jgi:hypothetical protein
LQSTAFPEKSPFSQLFVSAKSSHLLISAFDEHRAPALVAPFQKQS